MNDLSHSINDDRSQQQQQQPRQQPSGTNNNTAGDTAIAVQQTTIYRNINEINREGKILQDTCDRFLNTISRLPRACLEPCSTLSCLLFLLVLVAYLVATIWASIYNIYSFEYYNIDNEYYHTSILIQSDDKPIINSLNNKFVCDHYNLKCVYNNSNPIDTPTLQPTPTPTRSPLPFNSDLNSDAVTTSNELVLNDNSDNNDDMVGSVQALNVYLKQLEMYDTVLIKTQWFISWLSWVRLRIFMLDIKLLSWKYVMYFIIQNAVSWNFRSLGFIVLSEDEHILYSAYYSNAFINAILTFAISGLIWLVLVGLCLKRKQAENKPESETMMVLRRWGNMDKDGKIDCKSIIANIFVFLFFGYLCFVPTIWLVYDNMTKEIDDNLHDSSDLSNKWYLHKSVLGWVNLFVAQIEAYFEPNFEWYYPFTIATILQNCLSVVDIIVFILKVVNDFVEKCQRRRRPKNRYQRFGN